MMLSHVKEGFWSLLSNIVMLLMLPVPSPHKPLAGYDSLDVNFGRFYKAATQTSKQLLKEVFIIMLHRSHVCFVEEWPTTMADYCFIILSWSKAKYRESFTAQEREMMEQSITSAEFDVSLITKMIHKLFSSMKLSEPLTRAIRDVKNIRNRVCHEYQVLDNAQVRDNFDDLKTAFKNLLNEMEEFFSVDTDDLQRIYLLKVDDILSSPSTAEATEYFEKAELFQADLVGKFITRGRQELMNFYVKLKSLNPFTWLSDEKYPEMLVDKIFTPLHISGDGRSINMASILNTEILDKEAQKSSGVLPSVLVMSGIAGCGKTSLCRYFLHNWRTKLGAVTRLRPVDVLIHIEIRNVTCNSLMSYLQRTLLQDTLTCYGEQDIVCILQQINVLYIIDGVDEATADGIQLVNNVLSILGNSRVILTTRPEFSYTLIQTANRHHLTSMIFNIQGFSGQGITDFTSRVFTAIEPNDEKRNRQEREFLQFLKTVGRSLGDQLKLPLTVALLICLWRDDHTRLLHVSCVTRLYFEIFRMCTMKLIMRLQTNAPLHHLELEAFSKEWLLSLAKVAYRMLEKDEYAISGESRDMLVSLCTARQINSIQVLSAFLSCEVDESVRGIQYQFSFIHKSQMEYLASMHLVNDMTSKPQPDINIVKSLQQRFATFNISKKAQSLLTIPVRQLTAFRWTNTLKFVVGHLCINKVKDSVLREVVEQLLELTAFSHNASSLWQVVQESECHPTVCHLVGKIKNYMWSPQSGELCDPMEPNFQLLKHTRLTPESVYIRVVGSVDGIRVLGENGRVERKACENILPLLTCLAQRPSVHTVLRMDQHYYNWGSPESTDALLTTLLPQGNLTALMGHVGVPGATALTSVIKMGEVCLRVSDPDTLHVLKNTLCTGKIFQFTLRLDIPSTVSPSSLPNFKNSPDMIILLRQVDDTGATWAAEVLAQLSRSYKEVDLVASSLTPNGADKFLGDLVDRHIGITDSLTIRSCHQLDETHYQQMSSMFRCSFAWWN